MHASACRTIVDCGRRECWREGARERGSEGRKEGECEGGSEEGRQGGESDGEECAPMPALSCRSVCCSHQQCRALLCAADMSTPGTDSTRSGLRGRGVGATKPIPLEGEAEEVKAHMSLSVHSRDDAMGASYRNRADKERDLVKNLGAVMPCGRGWSARRAGACVGGVCVAASISDACGCCVWVWVLPRRFLMQVSRARLWPLRC